MARPRKPGIQTVQTAHAVQIQHKSHSGPLPAPEDLHRYNEISPGAAERIFIMAESEQRHRHDMERMAIEADTSNQREFQLAETSRIAGIFKSDRRGQYLGATVSIIAISSAVAAVYFHAHWSVPIAFLSLPVMGMVKALRQHATTKTQTDEQTS